ncbi:MAG: glycosyltransferase [Planctomycetes bacterium]|jgi:glycosyltransferase involved in cell wall biosynthesis|nr:glycosyltransferase [Planctomycetota bacterium]
MALSVSAILPTHDRPVSLRRCVESILAQTRRPEELIVVNDGRDDLRADLIDDLNASAVSARFLRRDEASSTASRNAGLGAAAGDVMLLLEDDIVLPPDFIARLVDLYAADADGVVGGIGPTVREPDTELPSGRLWLAVERALGRGRWGPHHVASRYASLPPELAGRLLPVRKLSAGGLSLRGEVAAAFHFDEMLSGYAWGEDRELTFRIAPHHALYRAPELVVLHHRQAGGRGDWKARGRAYISNTCHIAQSVAGGAGTGMLAVWDIAATMLQYAAWSPVSRTGGEKRRFVGGMLQELLARGASSVGRFLCG